MKQLHPSVKKEVKEIINKFSNMENEGYETDYLRRPFMYDSRHYYENPPAKQNTGKYRFIIGFIASLLTYFLLKKLNAPDWLNGFLSCYAMWLVMTIARDYRKWEKHF
jgi:hypothetical protein